jgi:hypothetical protein
MTRKASSYQRVSTSIVAAGAALALLAQATPSYAEEVSPTGKGVVGGGLLGAEVVMLLEAAVGVKSGWLYLLGGAAGAGGGAVAGLQFQKNSDPKVSLYLLAGGMALVIPTTVAVLQATSYKAPEDYTEDRPSGAPVPEPPRPTTPGAAGPQTRLLHYHWQAGELKMPLGLVDVDDGAFKVAVPAVEVRPVYNLSELRQYGLEQQHELRVPVFSATF